MWHGVGCSLLSFLRMCAVQPKIVKPRKPSRGDAQPDDELEIKVIRSKRRKKTVDAHLVDSHTLEVRAPADLPEAQLQIIIKHLKARIIRRRKALRDHASDGSLERRARQLNAQLFAGALSWQSIRFVSNQNTRFGSCSPARGTLRISDRLSNVPSFVLDYVIVHELAHLQVANHSKAFWDRVYRYPKTERARGYLMAMQMEDDTIDDEE